ncbi:thiopeptide-type bacteriocin biosynthesis protein [Kitasatospora sp. NPDC056651]|uniref:thiopeptide-type bacteriocin biosynthesis protein n=1 Tax=Kitasatospora sp. NPDC056651 TaxID=3345892 RepID=UPI003687719C
MDDGYELWQQSDIRFVNRHRAEQAAADHLGDALRVTGTGPVESWFFIRKDEWRLRYNSTNQDSTAAARRVVTVALAALRDHGAVEGWVEKIYEPEVHAFGGRQAMDAAHRLFHQDSQHVLDYLRLPGPDRRRELSVLLCAAMMRCAGLDWYEQGDVWARVAGSRPGTGETSEEQVRKLRDAVARLLVADPRSGLTSVPDGTSDLTTTWLDAFEQAGRMLHLLWSEGRLTRGVRAVIAHHVIFHWNRIGLRYPTQSALALAAKDAVLGT